MLSVDTGETKAGLMYYVQGTKEPMVLEEEPPQTDYLTDFLNMVNGNNKVVLPMEDVFSSARIALKVQHYNNAHENTEFVKEQG